MRIESLLATSLVVVMVALSGTIASPAALDPAPEADLLPCGGHLKWCLDLPPDGSEPLPGILVPTGKPLFEDPPVDVFSLLPALPDAPESPDNATAHVHVHVNEHVHVRAAGIHINEHVHVNEHVRANASVDAPPPGGSTDGDREYVIPCQDECPDLSVDGVRLLQTARLGFEFFTADDCNVAEGSTEPGVRRLLRFTTKTPNLGEGDLSLGDPSGKEYFEWADCHQHWHFQSYADYRLWEVPAYAEWIQLRRDDPGATAEEVLEENPGLRDGLVAGRKQGFCLVDVEMAFIILPITPTHHRSCSNQGISPGWADVYGSALDGQFIDVTGVPPGAYVLEVEVNPHRIIEEGSYGDNSAAVLLPIA